MISFSTLGKKRSIKIWPVMFWLVVWQITSLMIGQEILLVSPVSAIGTLVGLVRQGAFWTAVYITMRKIMLGFLAGSALGIGSGILSYRFALAESLLYPLLHVMKSVPVASFIILCLIWISSKNLAVFTAFLMTLPIIYANTLEGIRNTDQKLLEMSVVFKISRWKKIYYIYIPQLMPYLKSACTIAVGMCWKSGIAAEVIGTPAGSIGEKLYLSKIYLNMRELFAWTIVIVIISVVIEKLILSLIELLQYWMERR